MNLKVYEIINKLSEQKTRAANRRNNESRFCRCWMTSELSHVLKYTRGKGQSLKVSVGFAIYLLIRSNVFRCLSLLMPREWHNADDFHLITNKYIIWRLFLWVLRFIRGQLILILNPDANDRVLARHQAAHDFVSAHFKKILANVFA